MPQEKERITYHALFLGEFQEPDNQEFPLQSDSFSFLFGVQLQITEVHPHREYR